MSSGLGEGAEEDLKLTVKLQEGSKLPEEKLWEWATQNLARIQVPSVLEFVQEIQRTPTGKIEKHALNIEGGQRLEIRRKEDLESVQGSV